ncbi:hypothetical protein BDR03DRAFT_986444 [Suillus americanus]|nr:hypothetical protein BDR03DRAFT_986444 [Suillus americanus]
MALHYVLVGRSDTEKSDDAKAKIVKTEAQLEIQSSWLPFAPEEQVRVTNRRETKKVESGSHTYIVQASFSDSSSDATFQCLKGSGWQSVDVKMIVPLYVAIPGPAFQLSSAVFRKVIVRKLRNAQNLQLSAWWNEVAVALLSGVLDFLDKHCDDMTKETIASAFYPTTCTLFFHQDASLTLSPRTQTTFDKQICHVIHDDFIDRHILCYTKRLADIRVINGGCEIIPFLEDYLVIEALLYVVGWLIPMSDNTEKGTAKRTEFINDLFGSEKYFSCSPELVNILQYISSSYWEDTVMKIMDALAKNDITFPQSFALDEVDICGKCHPQPTAFDRLHLDREFFLANVVGQDDVCESLKISYGHVRSVIIDVSKAPPLSKIIVYADLTIPPSIGDESLAIPEAGGFEQASFKPESTLGKQANKVCRFFPAPEPVDRITKVEPLHDAANGPPASFKPESALGKQANRSATQELSQLFVFCCTFASAMYKRIALDNNIIAQVEIAQDLEASFAWVTHTPTAAIDMGRRKRNSSVDERPTVNELRAKMDKRPVEANAPTNDPAQATQKMDMQLAKCRLGVAYIDILNIQNPLLFGKYNDRPQVEREVNKLITSFKKEGILAMREDTAIPIMLSSTRLASGLHLALNFNEEEEVPQLQLEDAHGIVVASGQHRVAALKKYSKNVVDEIASIEKRRHKISEMKKPTQEHIAEYNSLRNELAELQGALILMGKWGTVVYDEDAILAHGDDLANHLCRNKSLHEYKETTEEVLTSILRLLKTAYKNAPEDEQVAAAQGELRLQRDNTERQKNARLTKVLSYEKLVLTLALDLLPLGSHFRRRKEFQITWLARSIDVVMGFHSHILHLLASDDIFPDYATVSKTIATAYDEGSGHDEAVKKLEEWRQMIYDSTVSPDATIFNDVFDDISTHVSEQFRNVPLKDVGTKAPNYTTSLDNYSNYLVRKLRSKWHLSRTKPSQWNAIAQFHDRVTARIAVWLTPKDGVQEAPFPLLCGHVLDIAWSILTSNSAALEEVSGWFEPLLLHYRTLHRHSHLMDDKTEVMFTNLRNDPRVLEFEKIEEAVFTCLWALRTTMVLRLQNKLTTTVARSQQSQPFKDRKEVDENFERLGSAGKNDLKKLRNMMALRKGRGRDLTTEPQVIRGILALHVTSWDWNNCVSKNSKRDMEPFIKAILLDLGRERTRREDLFNDPLVAGLRKILEDVIAKHAGAINMIGEGGRTIKRKRWSWYDGAEIPSDVAPTTTATLTDDEHVMDARIQHRHELEGHDRAAIIKLISYVKHMAGAKATSSTHSPMAANVVRGLQNLIHELEINSTRLRIRALEGDDSVLYNIKDTVDLMIPAIKGVEDQNTIDEQEDEQALPRTSTVPVVMQAHKPQPQILTNFDDHASLSKSYHGYNQDPAN